MSAPVPCPECAGASLELRNEHVARTGCRSYRLTRVATVPVRPAVWLAREFPLPARDDRRDHDRFPPRPS